MDANALETGSLIKEYRRKKGLTQGELGEKVGVTASAIMRYEQGKRGVTLEMLNRIAIALECDPYSLMSFDIASEAIFDRINTMEQINRDCDRLNDEGVKLVAAVVHLAAESPRYRAEARQETAERVPASPVGKTPTPPAPPPDSPAKGGDGP